MRETDLLDEYLAEERGKPFSWDSYGTGDCLMFLAGWWIALHGADPVPDLRGEYCDEPGARAAIAAKGGAVALLDSLADRRIGAPQRGDIGLLEFQGWHLGMICTGGMWTSRAGENGVRWVRRAPEIVWLPKPRSGMNNEA